MINIDISYIIKRVIIGVLISIILMFIGSINIKAASIQMLLDPVNYGSFSCSNTSNIAYSGNWYRGCSPQIDGVGWQMTHTLDNINNNFMVTGTFLYQNTQTPLISANNVQCEIINTFYDSAAFTNDTNLRVGNISSFVCRNVPVVGSLRIQVKLGDSSAGNFGVWGGISNPLVLTQELDNSSTVNAINDLNNSVNDVNNSINSEEAPTNNDISNNSNAWSNNNANNGVINQLVTMPITLINSVVNGLSSSCSPYNLGSLFGTNLIMPCVNMSNILGELWTLIDIIISGIFIFLFGGKCVRIFNDFTNLKGGQVDTLYGGGN